jgi:RimJ/RimL family protein N-acetyltransferase
VSATPTAPRTPEPRPPLAAALRDGTPIQLRAIRPTDKALLTEGMEHLSLRSRYRRFFSPIRRLSEQQLQDFTEVDHINHFAWVATIGAEPQPEAIGVARYVRDDEDPTVAEVAVTVLDRWQGRGAGTVLLAATALAALDNDVRRLRADVLAENTPMMAVFRRLGGVVTGRRQEILAVELDVVTNRARLSRALGTAPATAQAAPPTPAS